MPRMIRDEAHERLLIAMLKQRLKRENADVGELAIAVFRERFDASGLVGPIAERFKTLTMDYGLSESDAEKFLTDLIHDEVTKRGRKSARDAQLAERVRPKRALPTHLLDDIVINFMEYGRREPIGPKLSKDSEKAKASRYFDAINETALKEKKRLGIKIRSVGRVQELQFGSVDSLLRRYRKAKERRSRAAA
jgi:hypothetical protein